MKRPSNGGSSRIWAWPHQEPQTDAVSHFLTGARTTDVSACVSRVYRAGHPIRTSGARRRRNFTRL
jgi:hypothetical protein